ncbi:hypothetical protein AnigIFM49718_006688 [Aspergillus niger]|nr:hypothetical protein AnigIFM49718_006688 [Aspergillus niger]
MDSPHQIFLIPEVLEPVLLNLDTTTLLLSQRVCHLWNSLIKTSPSLQTALFFRPRKESSTSTPALKPKRTVNPLMNKLLKHFISNHGSSFHRDFSSYLSRFGPHKSSSPSTSELERRHPYLCPEASWREMLLHQPPAPTLAVSDDLIPLGIGGVPSNESNAVLRLKPLERLVQVPTTEHEVDIPFILMSKAPSWPLAKAWKTTGSGEPELAAPLKAKGLYQLETMTYKLSQLRFNQIGSLFKRAAFSSTVPEALMIASPGLSQSRYELDENLVQAFQTGFAAAAAEDTRMNRQ